MIETGGKPGSPSVLKALPAFVPRSLLRAVLVVAGIEVGDELPRAARLTKSERHALVETSKGLPIPIDGTLGFDLAEVTAGGLSLREVDPRSMKVNRHEGLWVIGELLDLDGPIGGLSFQAAFATAELAARSIVSSMP